MLDELPDRKRQRTNGTFFSTTRDQMRKNAKKPKKGKKMLGWTSSFLQFSLKPVKPVFQDENEKVQFALRTFQRLLLNAGSTPRSPMKVLAMMKERYPYLVAKQGTVGHVAGVEVGQCFRHRAQLCLVGLHRPPMAGIDWTDIDSDDGQKMSIALSIVVSGGYEDDFDEGETLTYTGEGGQDDKKRQCSNQTMTGANYALRYSCRTKRSVRVIRGRPDPSSAGRTLYSYDGLYKVVDWTEAVGISEFTVFKFKLVREANQEPLRWPFPVCPSRKKVSRGF